MRAMIRVILSVLTLAFFTGCRTTNMNTEEDRNAMKVKELTAGRNAVSFKSEGLNVAAHLFLPADYEAGESYPAIIVSPPASGVKEQTAGTYAEAMSKRGFAALAYDPRGWGESEGQDLYFDPYEIVKDAKNAVSYMSTLDVVDKENIFDMGICMGAGFAAYETAFDTRVKGLAMVSPYLMDLNDFITLLGGASNVRSAVLPSVSAASQKYYETGEDSYRKMVPETEEEIGAATPVGLGMREYYLPGMPGDVPNWVNGQSFVGGDSLLSFSIFNFTQMLESLPVYVAYGDLAVSKRGAIRFAKEVADPANVKVIEGAGHFDLYWMPEHVEPISDEIAEFFKSQMD